MDTDENAFRSPPESPLNGKDVDGEIKDRTQLRSDVMSKLEEKRQQLRRQRSHSSRQRVWRLKSQNSRLGSNGSVGSVGDSTEQEVTDHSLLIDFALEYRLRSNLPLLVVGRNIS